MKHQQNEIRLVAASSSEDASRFSIKLQQPLDLNNDWRLAVSEIIVSSRIFVLQPGEDIIKITTTRHRRAPRSTPTLILLDGVRRRLEEEEGNVHLGSEEEDTSGDEWRPLAERVARTRRFDPNPPPNPPIVVSRYFTWFGDLMSAKDMNQEQLWMLMYSPHTNNDVLKELASAIGARWDFSFITKHQTLRLFGERLAGHLRSNPHDSLFQIFPNTSRTLGVERSSFTAPQHLNPMFDIPDEFPWFTELKKTTSKTQSQLLLYLLEALNKNEFENIAQLAGDTTLDLFLKLDNLFTRIDMGETDRSKSKELWDERKRERIQRISQFNSYFRDNPPSPPPFDLANYFPWFDALLDLLEQTQDKVWNSMFITKDVNWLLLSNQLDIDLNTLLGLTNRVVHIVNAFLSVKGDDSLPPSVKKSLLRWESESGLKCPDFDIDTKFPWFRNLRLRGSIRSKTKLWKAMYTKDFSEEFSEFASILDNTELKFFLKYDRLLTAARQEHKITSTFISPPNFNISNYFPFFHKMKTLHGLTQNHLFKHLYGYGSVGRNVTTHRPLNMARRTFLLEYDLLRTVAKDFNALKAEQALTVDCLKLLEWRNGCPVINPPNFDIKAAFPWYGILETSLGFNSAQLWAHLFSPHFDRRIESVSQLLNMGEVEFFLLYDSLLTTARKELEPDTSFLVHKDITFPTFDITNYFDWYDQLVKKSGKSIEVLWWLLYGQGRESRIYEFFKLTNMSLFHFSQNYEHLLACVEAFESATVSLPKPIKDLLKWEGNKIFPQPPSFDITYPWFRILQMKLRQNQNELWEHLFSARFNERLKMTADTLGETDLSFFSTKYDPLLTWANGVRNREEMHKCPSPPPPCPSPPTPQPCPTPPPCPTPVALPTPPPCPVPLPTPPPCPDPPPPCPVPTTPVEPPPCPTPDNPPTPPPCPTKLPTPPPTPIKLPTPPPCPTPIPCPLPVSPSTPPPPCPSPSTPPRPSCPSPPICPKPHFPPSPTTRSRRNSPLTCEQLFQLKELKDKTWGYEIDLGQNTSKNPADLLIKHLVGLFSDLNQANCCGTVVAFNEDTQKIIIAVHEDEEISLLGRLPDIYSLPSKMKGGKVYTSAYCVDVLIDNRTLYIYSDTTKEIILGEKHLPVLQTFAYHSSGKNNDLTHTIFNPPLFLELNKHHLVRLELAIYNEIGEKVRFPSSTPSIVKLVFKKF